MKRLFNYDQNACSYLYPYILNTKANVNVIDKVTGYTPNATFLTTFTGNQEDAALAKRVAQAHINAGADMVFTMLNNARSGVTEAARENGVYQFANVRDYYADAPDVFIGSAISDASLTVYGAIKDLTEGTWKPNMVKKIGLENPDAVRLALSPIVPQDVKDTIAAFADKIKTGPEFIAN